ncbi:MAG: hypothetical protein R3B48_03125 [Kofleriaceae bacterium]
MDGAPLPAPARHRAAWRLLGSLAAAGVAVSVTALTLSTQRADPQLASAVRPELRPPPSAPAPAPSPPRLLVLPPSSSPADAHLSQTFAEDLIATLGERARQLEVIAPRTALRYQGTERPLRALAAELSVDYVVEGTLRTVDGERRLAVQLVRGRDEIQLWARTFRLTATAALPAGDVAGVVAQSLAMTLTPRTEEPALPAAAEDAYLQGRYAMHRHRIFDAMNSLALASQLAPDSAKVWAARARAAMLRGDRPARPRPGVSDCPDCSGSAAARRFAETALRLAAPAGAARAEAHLVLARLAFYREWAFERAFAHFTASLTANPAHAEAHNDFAAYFAIQGRHDEAIASVRRALALDPAAPEVVSDVGWYYFFARRFAEAVEWSERTLGFEPRYAWAHRCVVLAHLELGDFVAAAAAAGREVQVRRGPEALRASLLAPRELRTKTWRGSWQANLAAARALHAYWRWDLDHVFGDVDNRAVARMGMGDLTGALTELERAAERHVGWLLPFLAVDPTFDPLRDDARFQALLAKVRGEAPAETTASTTRSLTARPP